MKPWPAWRLVYWVSLVPKRNKSQLHVSLNTIILYITFTTSSSLPRILKLPFQRYQPHQIESWHFQLSFMGTPAPKPPGVRGQCPLVAEILHYSHFRLDSFPIDLLNDHCILWDDCLFPHLVMSKLTLDAKQVYCMTYMHHHWFRFISVIASLFIDDLSPEDLISSSKDPTEVPKQFKAYCNVFRDIPALTKIYFWNLTTDDEVNCSRLNQFKWLTIAM